MDVFAKGPFVLLLDPVGTRVDIERRDAGVGASTIEGGWLRLSQVSDCQGIVGIMGWVC